MFNFLPFKHVKSFVDVQSKQIYINQNLIFSDDIEDCIRHEMAHILSGDCDHGDEWEKTCKGLGLHEEIQDTDLLKVNRGKLGIPEHIAGNIGNISGIQNILTDYHLLQAYRKFSQRILGTEGTWEFSVEANTIRLFPVPKGSFPVIVRYLPNVTSFKSPQAREITYRAFLARMKEALGHARRKFGGIPGPDGSVINFDGDALVAEGREEYEKVQEDAIRLGEPIGPYLY